MNQRRPWLASLIHAVRVILVAALLFAIPSPRTITPSGADQPPPLEAVRRVLPAAESIDDQPDANGLWQVRDAANQPISLVARTLPIAEDVVGYRGPSEAMILFDQELTIRAVRMLQSADTDEHVEATVGDELFFNQFQDWPWGGPQDNQRIDAVSGATLTSMALAEGVLQRIGGDRPSLVFPDPLTVEEVRDWFPDAVVIDTHQWLADLRNEQGDLLGRVIRSGSLCDDVVGYQGPTELLLRLEPDSQVSEIRIRSSYDNEPYVRYVKVEAGYWALFTGQSIDQLAALDPEAAGIEGVSGATMTSLAVADSIVATAAALAVAQSPQPSGEHPAFTILDSLRWTAADLATIAMLLAAAVASRMGWFHHRRVRRAWLVAVVVVVGLWAGNLISLALIAGWSAEGIAWRLAPGLTAIALVAMLIPPGSKSNPYCNHLCPHGAIQQWVRPPTHSRRKVHLPRPWNRWLRRLPGFSLVAAYLALLLRPSIDLSAIEPFHAYLFRIAGWGAIAFCLVTLAISTVVPMGYCRLGCPTGRLIDYLRRNARSDRIEWADYVALGLLALALLINGVEIAGFLASAQ